MDNCENLCENGKTGTPDNGWKQVFAYGRSRVKWTPEMLRVSFTEYLRFVDGSPLTKDMKMTSKTGGKSDIRSSCLFYARVFSLIIP